MVYLLAACAALANAATSIFQRMGVEDAPAEDTLRLSLMMHAIRRGIWLLGFLLMVVSFIMQAVALHFGDLTTVQPILTSELLFLVGILVVWFRFPITWREAVGTVAVAAGLAFFLVCAQPGGGTAVPTNRGWLLVGLGCAAAVFAAVVLAHFGPKWWRAAMFGTSAAIGFAFTAGLTKVVTGFIAQDWPSMFRHWQTYVLALVGVLSVFLAQNAFHAGPIAASQSTLVLVDPIVSILIGVSLFGDQVRTSGIWVVLEILTLSVMAAGAILLSHSPLITGVRGEDEDYHVLLSRRARSEAAREASGSPGLAAAGEGSMEVWDSDG